MRRLFFIALLWRLSFEANALVPIYSQPPIPSDSTLYPSSGNGNDYDRFVWDNFTLSSSGTITQISWRGGYDLVIASAGYSGPVLDFSVAIWGSIAAGTQPDIGSGPLLLFDSIGGNAGETLVGQFGMSKMYDYSYVLPTPFRAAPGTKYWVQMKAFQAGVPDWGFAAATGGDNQHFGSFVNYAGGTAYAYYSGDAAFTLLAAGGGIGAPLLAPEPAFTSGTANRLSWSAVAGARDYYLEWSQSNLFTPVIGNSGWTTATTFLVAGLTNGQTCYYRVKCRDVSMAQGGWSNVVSSRQDALPPTAPGTPRDAGAYTSSTTVRFSWTAATDTVSGVASYDLQVGTAPGASNIFNANVGNVLTRTVMGANGQRLYARVRGRDRVGYLGTWSANSDGITIDTVAPRLVGAGPPNSYAVNVSFDDDVVNADRAANYTFTRGLAVHSAERLSNRVYRLHTSAQTSGTSYTVTVKSAVTDRAGNPVNPLYRSRAFRGAIRLGVRSWEWYR